MARWQVSRSDSHDTDGSYVVHSGAAVLAYGSLDECAIIALAANVSESDTFDVDTLPAVVATFAR